MSIRIAVLTIVLAAGCSADRVGGASAEGALAAEPSGAQAFQAFLEAARGTRFETVPPAAFGPLRELATHARRALRQGFAQGAETAVNLESGAGTSGPLESGAGTDTDLAQTAGSDAGGSPRRPLVFTDALHLTPLSGSLGQPGALLGAGIPVVEPGETLQVSWDLESSTGRYRVVTASFDLARLVRDPGTIDGASAEILQVEGTRAHLSIPDTDRVGVLWLVVVPDKPGTEGIATDAVAFAFAFISTPRTVAALFGPA